MTEAVFARGAPRRPRRRHAAPPATSPARVLAVETDLAAIEGDWLALFEQLRAMARLARRFDHGDSVSAVAAKLSFVGALLDVLAPATEV